MVKDTKVANMGTTIERETIFGIGSTTVITTTIGIAMTKKMRELGPMFHLVIDNLVITTVVIV